MDRFSELGTLIPANLPIATEFRTDYHQEHSAKSISQALEVYFENGFVYNIDQKIPEWIKEGWIPAPKSTLDLGSKYFSEVIYKKLAAEMSEMTNGVAQPTIKDLKYNNIEPWVNYTRSHRTHKKMPLCSGVLM